jgi:hypothetical protein
VRPSSSTRAAPRAARGPWIRSPTPGRRSSRYALPGQLRRRPHPRRALPAVPLPPFVPPEIAGGSGRKAGDRLRSAGRRLRRGPSSRTVGRSTFPKASFEQGAAFLLAPHRVDPADASGDRRPGAGSRHAAAGGSGARGAGRALGGEVVGAVGSREKLDDAGSGRGAGRHAEIAGRALRRHPRPVGGTSSRRGLDRRPLGMIVGVGFAGGCGGRSTPRLVGRNASVAGFTSAA